MKTANEVEKWKMITGYDGYAVSDRGRVISLSSATFLKERKNEKGYVRFHLPSRRILGHRLVAHAFLPPPKEGCTQINHKNGDASDNRSVNLEWVTPGENLKHAYCVLGRFPSKAKSGGRSLGENENAKPVILLETGEVFSCAKEAALMLNIDYGSLVQSCNYKIRAGGLHFSYIKRSNSK